MRTNKEKDSIEAGRTPVQRCFGNSLVALYLHGSAVAGGLHPHSDVDLLAVIDQPMTIADRRRLITELMNVSGQHPAAPGNPRPIDLIVFLRADLTASIYPACSEFVYGEWRRDAFEAGEVPEPESDPEFTLLLAQARVNARPLIGPDPVELLPSIPEADIRRAIGDLLPVLLDTLEGDERNVLLTLVRMWRTLTTGEFVPKDVAADWAVPRLTPEAAALVGHARAAHLGAENDDWRGRQQEVARVAEDLRERIRALL